MEIRKEIKQVNCYPGKNKPAWIVIHETDNYSKGAGAVACPGTWGREPVHIGALVCG